MLTQQIISEARTKGMPQIAVKSSEAIPAAFSETTRLHDILGFATIAAQQPT